MASKFFERRAVRNQLKTYLEAHQWTGLTWAEGFSQATLATVVPPFVSVILDDVGRDELEMGPQDSENATFTRRIQIDVYMESEDRVNAITDDISDFLDLEAIIIKDNSNNVLGSMISDTSSIIATTIPPVFDEEQNLDWRGVVSCLYDTHYPEG